ncbi:MAG: copper chaperone PCu(A)C [Methylobacillus sp.]|jgi:copper(I)-binding protein|nr:copper chaperone PCu(A)C [Methylobacillus sp.]
MKRLLCMLGLLLTTFAASAEQPPNPVEASHAWARATAPGQTVGAAYMQLKSAADLTLVAVESPIAGSVAIHHMSMKNNVMEMHMMDSLELPANQTVKLEPGGMHLMLMDLKQPLKAGETVSLMLTLKDKSGKTLPLKLDVPVKRNADQD